METTMEWIDDRTEPLSSFRVRVLSRSNIFVCFWNLWIAIAYLNFLFILFFFCKKKHVNVLFIRKQHVPPLVLGAAAVHAAALHLFAEQRHGEAEKKCLFWEKFRIIYSFYFSFQNYRARGASPCTHSGWSPTGRLNIYIYIGYRYLIIKGKISIN